MIDNNISRSMNLFNLCLKSKIHSHFQGILVWNHPDKIALDIMAIFTEIVITITRYLCSSHESKQSHVTQFFAAFIGLSVWYKVKKTKVLLYREYKSDLIYYLAFSLENLYKKLVYSMSLGFSTFTILMDKKYSMDIELFR